MHPHTRSRNVHLLFTIGLFGKAVDGVLEIVGGVALLVVTRAQFTGWLRLLLHHELTQDPDDLLANWLLHTAGRFSANTQAFAALFLLWHGAVKVVLVWALWRRLLWAYPIAMAAFAAFVAYQLYRFTHTHSPWLLALSVIDVGVIVLTWLEYKHLKAGDAERPRPT